MTESAPVSHCEDCSTPLTPDDIDCRCGSCREKRKRRQEEEEARERQEARLRLLKSPFPGMDHDPDRGR